MKRPVPHPSTGRLHEHLDRRYGGAAAPPLTLAHAAGSDMLSLLLSHRSVRAYADTPLDDAVLTALTAAAQSAATSSNLQAWSLVAVTDPARKARLAELAGSQPHVVQCPLFLVWLADLSRLARVAAGRNAPAAALPFLELYTLALVDAALAAQNAVVAAEALGLGTVFIGGLRNRPERVSAELGLPAQCFATFGLCVGYPDPSRPASIKPRLPPPAVLHRDQYATSSEADLLERYDERLAAFQAAQGLPAPGWTPQVARRVAGARSLAGRDRLRQALGNLGFQLE
ncbi:nitroreductase family protein [Bordetella parapertussis]|uniref:Nitroreductase n=1 Tax=Bordetella parapertussis (strain Bpp5) TaxID=1208660 RepID=K0M9L6_BORPB|nr:nitroreductase family protein [Bordetella parapertussis]CCJ50470.1 putative nitroreductase [Bordetella parapertussis Bpp5]